MDSKLILVVIGVIAVAFGRSEAITCYLCESSSNSNCRDPFDSDGVPTCNATACIKSKTAESGEKVVARSCSSASAHIDVCGEVSTAELTGTSCVCTTDYCNDGQMVKPTLCNVVIGVAMATVMSIAWMNKI